MYGADDAYLYSEARPSPSSTYRTTYFWGVVHRTVSATYTGKVKDYDSSPAKQSINLKSHNTTRQITITGGPATTTDIISLFSFIYLYINIPMMTLKHKVSSHRSTRKSFHGICIQCCLRKTSIIPSIYSKLKL